MKTTSLLVALAVLATPLPVIAGPGGEQGQARKELRAGNVRSLREIEQRVLPTMGGSQYLGPEYDPAAMAYRLKFIRDGRVIFVDIDARTGQVMRQSR
ncbi:hypothetical protein B0I00_0300 [Novosphingobium kunmingense]|uniref:Peptidase YpeB-like protein n=1 Tax=Novosphingobium kunmingense TaxID=1211806 RepID=A0A2N0I1R7_9SPHN|nr:PepSY domain-containing protein [Novosphingobium kunmingense]PKB25116.1 hypothetical protein B0I00_0300 [Novosphingobium kunmingense]